MLAYTFSLTIIASPFLMLMLLARRHVPYVHRVPDPRLHDETSCRPAGEGQAKSARGTSTIRSGTYQEGGLASSTEARTFRSCLEASYIGLFRWATCSARCSSRGVGSLRRYASQPCKATSAPHTTIG
jgi:hypothetical protein